MIWLDELSANLIRKIGRWPQPVRHHLAEIMAKVAYPLIKKRRHVAQVNLRKCFPEWSDEQIKQTIKTHLRYFSHAAVDRSLFWFGPKTAIKNQIDLIDEHIWHEAVATGRPIIVLAPHFVGLDVGGSRLNLISELSSIYQKQRNETFDALFREGRAGLGTTYLFSRQEGIRGLVKLMKKNVPMYCLPDMDFGAWNSLFVPFFGVTAATLTVLPKLSQLTHALVVPCVTRLDVEALNRGETRYKMQFYPAWDGYPSDDETQAVMEMNAFIEARILEEPAQYLWFHKRFKTRPEGDVSFY